MPALNLAPAPQPAPQGLYAVNVRPRGDDPFPEAEFVTQANIPVFAEHETTTRDGRKLTFGYAELKAVADRCNRRIAETGDYATLAIGHNPDPQAKMMGAPTPDAVGFVGPFRMGTIQGMDGQQKYAILADLHYFRDDWQRAKKFARRSAELWVEDRYEEMFLDPIALLGAETPRLDLGLVYSRVHEGRAVEKYSAVFPGAMNVHVMGGPEDDTKDYQAEGASMIGPDDIKMIVDAISALPQWQYLESMMAAGEAEGATQGGTNTVGDALPGGAANGITPPVATPPAAPAAPPAAPGMPPAAEPPAPPMAMEPPGSASEAPKPPAAAGPPSPPSPEKEPEKEKNQMAFQKACYAALDEMDDDELQMYMAQRYGAGAKTYQADEGGSVPESTIDADHEPSAEATSYGEKPPNSDGSKELNTGGGPTPKKTEHTVTTYAKDANQSLKYQLDDMKRRLAVMEKERDEERIKSIDAVRMNRLLAFHHDGYLADPQDAFKRLCYAKIGENEELFESMLEMAVDRSAKIPVNRTLLNVHGAEQVVYDAARHKLDAAKGQQDRASRELYAKAIASVERRINAETKQGKRPDTTGWLDEELAKLTNGAAA